MKGHLIDLVYQEFFKRQNWRKLRATNVFFAYIGFDAISTTSQEAKNPQRDLPIGIIGSLGICFIIAVW